MPGKRIERFFKTNLSAPPKEVFPLLCPTREYDWIPQWQCQMVYSESGYAEPGCVFITDFNDPNGPETWVIYAHEPNRLIGFVKTGTHYTTRYRITVEPAGNHSTIVWKQEITSLSTQGDELLPAITEDEYRMKMVHINKMLDYYLQTGKPLPEPQK